MRTLSDLHVVLMGGTIDSTYDGAKDTAVPLKHSVVPSYLALVRLREALVTEICMKDSRQIDERDRLRALKVIAATKRSKVLVTHGTYTMPDTARFLQRRLKSKKTVVLTGSMIPLQGFSPSDAGFNLGFAVAQLEHLEPGVYVCMSGLVLSAEEAAKDMKRGEFYSLSDSKSGVR